MFQNNLLLTNLDFSNNSIAEIESDFLLKQEKI